MNKYFKTEIEHKNTIAKDSIKTLAKTLKKLFKEIRDRNDIDIKRNCSFKVFIREFRTFKISLPRRLGNTTFAKLLCNDNTIYIGSDKQFIPSEIRYSCTAKKFKKYSKHKQFNLVICDNCSIDLSLLKNIDTKNNKVIILYIGYIL